MKKIFSLALSVIVTSISLTSCLGTPSDSTTKGGYAVANLIIPTDQTQKPSLSYVVYSFEYNLTKGTLELGVDAMPIENSTLNFLTQPMDYTVNGAAAGTVQKFNIDQAVASGLATQVTDLTGIISTSVVNPLYTDFYITILKNFGQFQYFNSALIMSYTIGNRQQPKYIVRTFPTDAYYRGTLTTSTDNSSPQTTEKTFPRVYINVKEKKSDIVFHNLCIQPGVTPTVDLVIRNLDVTATTDGYTITGADIIPETPDGFGYTQIAQYKINSFSLTTTDQNMTRISIEADITGNHKISFTGSYLID